MVTIKGIPLDAPLYEIDSERGVEYWGCEAIAAFFLIDGEVGDLIPQGLRLAGEPAIGGVILAEYGNSTLGRYSEFVSLIQVIGPGGAPGLYVPYIYVTNDAAMAAGRELIGAPKKLARIELSKEYDVVQGIMERPGGKRLVTFTLKPSARFAREAMDAMLPPGTPLYSVRQTPPLSGRAPVLELVQWFADMHLRADAAGEEILFTGPASLTYDSPSAIDPVHRLGVGTMIAAIYLQFDMRLRAGGVVEISGSEERSAARAQ